MSRRNIVFLAVTAISLLADQLTKAWIVANVALYHGEIPLIPGFLSIVHAQNPGAAMGLLRDFEYRQHLFAVFTVIALIVILDLFRRLPKTDGFMALTLGLILSGAIGNGIDRLRQQYVTDFIKVYTEHPSLSAWLIETFGTNEWPSFNIADAALVVGVLLFLTHYLLVDEGGIDEGDADVGDADVGDATAPGDADPGERA